MTSREITDALASRHTWSPRTHVMVPNVAWGMSISEADLFVCSKARWGQEVEIKVSHADFKREFVTKPEKHERLVQGKPVGKWNPSQMKFETVSREPHIISRFWFAMPCELAARVLAEGLVPAHAGVLAVPEPGARHLGVGHLLPVEVLKPAPKLKMARQLTDAEYTDLLRLGYLRYWSVRGQEKEAA